jgi:hypothetical protein
MSWHHGDYLALTQATVAALAIVGAYGVVLAQESFQKRRNLRSDRALRDGIALLTQRANTLFERIKNTDLARELNATGHATAEIEKYRMSIRRRAQSMLASLDQIPLSAAAHADCVDVILYLREGLTELEALFGDCAIERGRPTGPAAARFNDACKQIILALQELGLTPVTVFDAARSQFLGSTQQSDGTGMGRLPINGHR